MNKQEPIFVKGLYFNEPHENAPAWVKGKLSINKGQFLNFLDELKANEKGYISIDMKVSKSGKTYFQVDNWKPDKNYTKTEKTAPAAAKDDDWMSTSPDDDVPF